MEGSPRTLSSPEEKEGNLNKKSEEKFDKEEFEKTSEVEFEK